MESTATALSATSSETTLQTAGAFHTSNDAFGDVKRAATTTEELSSSIAETNGQLVRASEVVRAAAIEAQSSNEEIVGLAQAAKKIDEAVKLIQLDRVICWRSMPQLKRRAPERPERDLPSSLPKSKRWPCRRQRQLMTSPPKFAAVQRSTQSAVDAISNITYRMRAIQQFTAGITTSVSQQNLATSDISRNVAAAASGTKSAVSVLDGVSRIITDMHGSADTVLMASQTVENAADHLRNSVDDFLRKVAV
jgi:methyl-accepting chemotaxis protein